jgi:predicted ArsR family transcriptional regulator
VLTEKIRKRVKAIASLGDPVRRQLYETVADAAMDLSRDEIAKKSGVARPLAAYHLERLLKDGLLSARFERRGGRTGPGAGRPTKLYFRTEAAVELSLPPRAYELAARVLADAVSRRQGLMQPVVDEAARSAGEEVVRSELATASLNDGRTLSLRGLLSELGYEPATDESGVTRLRNCVFENLANQHRELICHMNFALLRVMLSAFPEERTEATLAPADGRCCVLFNPQMRSA